MANNQVQGTGLGLSISKIIVEKLGGKIAVQSKMEPDHIHFYIALHFGKRRYEMGGKTYTGFH
jgi:Histidine kinase-, DNA gyrase B-, and HSP90-like ATPase.